MTIIYYLSIFILQYSFFIYHHISINNRLKKDGYTFVKPMPIHAKLNIIKIFLLGALESFLPVIGYMIFTCDSYDDIREKLLSDGSILKLDDHEKLPNTEPQIMEQQESVQERLTDLHQETEKLEFYLANKEKFDMFYQYMVEYIKQKVENQILSQMPPINVDDYSLDELKCMLAQFQNLQTKEDGKPPKTKF